MRFSKALTVTALMLAAATALAGCQRTPTVGTMNTAAATPPPPLSPAPVGGVQGSQLPPPSGAVAAPGAFPAAPSAPEPTGPSPEELAAASASAPAVTREALLGTWQTSVSGGNCQLALSLTRWTGGYRAASLRCPGEAANIAAWDVSGNQVVLNDRDGNTVARLFQAGPTQYNGSTSSGQSISLSR
jgi:hypothetical protein